MSKTGQNALIFTDPSSDIFYNNQPVSLLTQHGKERVIAPILDSALDCRVVHVSDYDTDLLGTFTRNIPRAGTQLEAARKKTRIGMELAGLPCGLASEGSFGPDPYTGMFAWGLEMIVWLDDRLELEVVGVASGKTNLAHLLTADWKEVEHFADAAGSPSHALVVRPEHEDNRSLRKGIMTREELYDAFLWASAEADNGRAFLETDQRAHVNPTRMEMIALAAQDLAEKLVSLCPACGVPGFQIAERVRGLPCEGCTLPTREIRADIHKCLKCSHQIAVARKETSASAGRCDYCNP